MLPVLEKVLEQLTSYLKVPELHWVARWKARKVALRETAKLCKNAALAGLCGGVVPRTSVLTSIARAVWNRDPELARVLILTPPLAQRHLHLVHGLPALVHPLEFADVFPHEKTQELSAALTAVKIPNRLKRPSRRAATRKLELWSPFGKRLVAAGFLAR